MSGQVRADCGCVLFPDHQYGVVRVTCRGGGETFPPGLRLARPEQLKRCPGGCEWPVLATPSVTYTIEREGDVA